MPEKGSEIIPVVQNWGADRKCIYISKQSKTVRTRKKCCCKQLLINYRASKNSIEQLSLKSAIDKLNSWMRC